MKNELHAFQSCEEKTGSNTQGLAVEQLPVLLAWRIGFVFAEPPMGTAGQGPARFANTAKSAAPSRFGLAVTHVVCGCAVETFDGFTHTYLRHPPLQNRLISPPS